MEIYVRPRQGGKTQMVIEALAADPKAVCITPNRSMTDHLIDRVMALSGRPLEEVMKQFPTNLEKRGIKPSKVYVEELDQLLARLLGHQVDVATFTGEVNLG